MDDKKNTELERSEWVINVEGLSKTFQKHPAVLDVTLKVKSGEIFGFLGPNGTGKTTTIRMLCGLLTPSGGRGYCLGFDILTQSRDIKAHVGYMPQYFSLYTDLTVYENLDLIGKLYGLKNRRARIENVIERLNLGKYKKFVTKSLSGGWKQRVSLAATLLHNPLLLLLDEPTAGVDPSSRRSFWELINQLRLEGVTVLLSSHNMDEVDRCHKIAYMAYGRVIMSGTIADIIAHVKLFTLEVVGPNLPLLARQLEVFPEIELVTSYYNALHVCSTDKELMEKVTTPFRQLPHYRWREINTRLEDVFIWLVSKNKDMRYAK